MKYALFLGCTVPVRGRNYEMSTRRVAQKLGIDFVDIPEFSCCGFPVKSTDRNFALTLCARNLALAEEKKLPVCVLCSACTAMLVEANHIFQTQPAVLDSVNSQLAKIGKHYSGKTEIKHFTRILYEDIRVEELKKFIQVDLHPFLFAPHYGCHYLKPSDIYPGFDSHERPHSIRDLILATGARATDLNDQKHCCGGAVMVVDASITYRMAAEKLEAVQAADADAMCLICPFCAVVYDDNQRAIQKELNREFNIPVLYYPQILGLAMGIDPKELGLKLNKVKTKALLDKLKDSADA